MDTSEVSDAGSCKVESWVSWASNRDSFAAASPSCAFNILRRVELGAQIARSLSDGDWTITITPKAKTKLKDSGIGVSRLAISSNASFDPVTGENTALAATVPHTMRFSDVVRLNLNGGWLWDRTVDRHYLI